MIVFVVFFIFSAQADIVLYRQTLRGINAQEEADGVGDIRINYDESVGSITIFAYSRDDMMAAGYRFLGVPRDSNFLRVSVRYSGGGWLCIKDQTKLWTNNYLLPEKGWGLETFYVSSASHIDRFGWGEVHVVVNGQRITIQSIKLEALDTEPVIRVIIRIHILFIVTGGRSLVM